MLIRMLWPGIALLAAMLLGLASCDDLEFAGTGRSDRDEPATRDRTGPLHPSGRTAHGADVRCWTSFTKFKRAMVREGLGKRGRDHEWHHIVAQHADNREKFKERNLHCTDNLVYLRKDDHTRLNTYYSRSRPRLGGKSYRDWLKPMGFDEQYAYGLQAMRDLEIQIVENPGVPF